MKMSKEKLFPTQEIGSLDKAFWQTKKFSLIVSAEKFDHSKKLAGLLFE